MRKGGHVAEKRDGEDKLLPTPFPTLDLACGWSKILTQEVRSAYN